LSGSTSIGLGGNIDRTDFGALDMQSGSKIILNGTTAQNIPTQNQTGSGADEFFISNLEINNTSNLPLNLEGPIDVNNNLDLKSGIIKTTETNILTLKDGATITGGDQNSYIDGPLIKQGQTGGLSFEFPLGKSGKYAPLQVSPIANPSSEIKAEYFGDPPPWGTNLSNGISGISNEYWTVSKTAVTDDVKITLSWSNETGITSLSKLLVARLNETNQDWENYGNDGTTGNTTTGTVTSSSLMGDPPPWGTESFAIGSKSSLNEFSPPVSSSIVLPVELTNFKAKQKNEIVQLIWETASELNTREFVVEHSVDGYTFNSIGNVRANGNSNIIQNYSYKHRTPEKGINYYRLRIVDMDGSFEYSQMEIVQYDKSTELNIFPNPVNKYINIHGDFKDHENVMIEIFDQDGKEIFVGTISFDNGRIMLDTDNVNISKPGTYVLRITSRSNTFVQKFIKTN